MIRRAKGVTTHPVNAGEFTRRGDDMPAPVGHSRWHVLWLLVVVALGAAACGAPAAKPVTQAAPAVATAVDAGADAGRSAGERPPSKAAGAAAEAAAGSAAEGTAGAAAFAVQPGDAAASGGAQHQGAAAPADRQPAKKADAAPADMDAFDVSASVSPECVARGAKITLTVSVPPQASVAYNAFYADGEAGGPPPYGKGYGGNNGGIATEDGTYTDSWTVAPNAPSGPGRIDVVAGTAEGFGKTSVAFAVADAVTGKCR